ncbi:thioesterase family protein [Streptomonospora nanhaiensis]|uniref:thioesterase family protein n=1 Tax=Streptomonospora nanhaiensis TaxID=1323731 RepID=UPI001C99CC42|nr:thioesterase family protein [Streptomonospora nanhaiensis]MBX9391891.1 thioesterase family protein [Streptomonospora nanhaiensis]
MSDFSTATEVRPRGTGGPVREFGAALDPRWSVGGKPHGGYLLAVLGRAAAEAAGDRPRLTAVSASFLEAAAPGGAVAEVEVLRVGRTSTQLRARLLQDGRPKVECLITQGALEDGDAWWSAAEPAELPAERDCFLAPPEVPELGLSAPLLSVVEHRLDPGLLGFTAGRPSGRGLVLGWQRLADGAAWDPLSVLVALDPIPSATLDLGIAGWAPTIQFSAYVRRPPAPGALRTRLRATDVGAGTMDLAAHVWDAKGRLVAQATQIAAVRIPGTPAPRGP